MSEQAPVVLSVGRPLAEQPWLRAVLAELGAELVAASHGEVALDRVAQSPPDLVLVSTDPGGLDAWEVCRRITQEPHTAHLPVFVVAMASTPALVEEAVAAGALDVLAPPVTRGEAAGRLRNALSRKRAYDQCRRRLHDLRQVNSARDGIARLALRDIDLMLGVAMRAMAGCEPSAPDAERYLRVAAGEVTAARETVEVLQLVRVIEDAEWRFDPQPCDLSTLLATLLEAVANDGGPAVAATLASDLNLRADGSLLCHGVRALLSHLTDRLLEPGTVSLSLSGQAGGARLELRAEGEVRRRDDVFDPVKSVLQLTLARMVAEAHGGWLDVGDGDPPVLVLWLPAEPPSGTRWPPSSVVSTGAPAGARSAPSEEVEAVDMLRARRELPAPLPSLRLPPPTAD